MSILKGNSPCSELNVIGKRFFKTQGPLALKEIAEVAGAVLERRDPERLIDGVAPLDQAGKNDLASFHNTSYASFLKSTQAGALLLPPSSKEAVPESTALLVMRDPHKGLALVLNRFYEEPSAPPSIHPSAHIASDAKLGAGCTIGAGVVIEEGVEIGDGCTIGPGSFIGRRVIIGHNCSLGPNVSVSHTCMGSDILIKPGACIGQRGFGFFMGEDHSERITQLQLGGVHIGDRVEIGANTTIDRGSLKDTIIESDVRIDNLVQIAHNVHLGQGSVIVAQAGVAGSTVLGKGVVLGGQSGVAGHLKVGEGARILAKSGVISHVKPFAVLGGYPAIPRTLFFRSIALLMDLTKQGTQNILRKNGVEKEKRKDARDKAKI